ncbi:NAD(P)-dependent dehydrogenase, short-chain alcohol dehydrogenase family [Roseomonas rosea]|uniref:NAD(P)-dependent dehydrogenase, short-chain alcohol dehydrogenase family n=1 Tax=Muricoccus roseus TaxID=198092 RepID=A0A1M6HHG5_9PROT|nr:SDR family oxidoreductase [Roseomonas rosea]SHJ21628.1 NAD(P)-dependent dehydrogenase, short-chain alcohol dehydrogenase family [Roseomonas rosea]
MTAIDKPVALVTGASSGIGLAIARRFAELGMQVVLVGRRQGALDAAASSLGAAALSLAADVTSPADLERLFAEVKARFGRLDVLVPNAGGGQHAPLGQITEAQFDQQFATNVKGVVFTVQMALPLMKPGASIVIVGSTASIDPGPTMSIYGATKAAVRNLVRSWVSDLKGSGIRINIVSPGPTNTASLRDAFGEHAEEGMAFLTAKSPIGRIGEPDEIAAVAAFLASDAASYVNGVELFADGGASQA